jgi:hypothetical protein
MIKLSVYKTKMQRCPIPFNHKNQVSFIEPFDASCPPSGEGGASSSPDYYENRRATNIEKLGEQYNENLAKYLNSYNRELVAKAVCQSGDSACQNDRHKAEEERQQFESKLQKLQGDLEQNNEQTTQLIKQQTQDIEGKTKAIEQKNSMINSQTEFIDDKNRIMNSRERQIELGVQKNIYKRNIMYFLVFVNVLVLCILLGIIYRGE